MPSSHATNEPMVEQGQALDDAMAMDDGTVEMAHTAKEHRSEWAAITPHHGARLLFTRFPWTRSLPVLGDCIEAFGPKFTFALGGFYFMNNGLAENIISSSKQPMFMKRYKVDALRYQRLAGVVTMGSSIKVVMATISDTFAIFGYRKRWYQFGSCIVGFCFCLGYALLPARPASADMAAAFIFLCTFCRMNSDILSQGHYSRLIRRTPKAGPQLVTWIYWMILLATLIAAVIMGPLADQDKTVNGIFLSAVMHLLPAGIFALNLYSEHTNRDERMQDSRRLRADLRKARRRTAGLPSDDTASEASGMEGEVHLGIPQKHFGDFAAEGEDEDNDLATKKPHEGTTDLRTAHLHHQHHHGEVATLDGDAAPEWDDAEFVHRDMLSYCHGNLEVNREMVRRNWKLVCYSCLMIAAVVTMACMTILGTTWDLLWASIAVGVTCIVCAFICLPRVIAKTEVAVFLDFILYVQLPGALDSFYVASSACVPDGPHFDYSFYTTVGAVIQNIAGLVGVTLFAYVFSKHSYQMVMVTTVIMRMVASVFDLVVVERWNTYIGIPDHAMFICGDAIVYQICYQLNYMPLVLVLSRVVQPGSESMVYALMSSIGNLGMTMSNTIGSLLMELVWPVDTSSTPCDYSNVKWLIITGHLASPVLIIPVSYLFLPRARMCDDIDMNGKVIKKHLATEQPEDASAPPQEPASTVHPDPMARQH